MYCTTVIIIFSKPDDGYICIQFSIKYNLKLLLQAVEMSRSWVWKTRKGKKQDTQNITLRLFCHADEKEKKISGNESLNVCSNSINFLIAPFQFSEKTEAWRNVFLSFYFS